MRFSEKPVAFSRHARRRLKWREISEAEVTETIRDPDEVSRSGEGARKTARRTTDRGTIKAIYLEESERVLVVTAMRRGAAG